MQAPLTGLSEAFRNSIQFVGSVEEFNSAGESTSFRKPRQGRLHSLACGCRRETRPTPVRQPLAAPPADRHERSAAVVRSGISTLNKRTGVPRLMLYAPQLM